MNFHETLRMKLQFATLRDHPELRADRVAAHYVAFAHMALQMKEAVKMYRHSPDPALADFINDLMTRIAEGHQMELGIALEWGDKPPAESACPVCRWEGEPKCHEVWNGVLGPGARVIDRKYSCPSCGAMFTHAEGWEAAKPLPQPK